MFNNKLKKGILVFSLLLLVFFVLPANFLLADDGSYPSDFTGSIYDTSLDASYPSNAGDYAKTTDQTTKPGEKLNSVEGAIAEFLTWITLGLASLFGLLLTEIMKMVNWLFSWQNFDGDGAVTEGWVIVRDICNMSFILVLLLIAFATILRLENYSMKKYLPKLLIMAVMINFSKAICFFLIDISQIVMLTFGNAFAGTSSNFITMLHIDELMAINKHVKFENMTWNLFFAAGLALVFILITFFVMIMLMGMLIMRMVMFWVLIVLSPIAFLTTAVPGGGKYWSQWWGEFTKYLTTGPILAFFVWLSLHIASKVSASISIIKVVDDDTARLLINEITKEGGVQKFIIAIGLLIGAMKITKSAGAMGAGIGAGLAATAMSGTKGFAKKHTVDRGVSAVKWGRDKAVAGAGAGARIGLAGLGTVDRLAGRGVDKIFKTKLGEKGVIASAGAGVMNLPGNVRDKIAARRGERAGLKQAVRDYYSAKLTNSDAIMKHNGKEYKADTNGEFKEIDATSKAITASSASLIANGKVQKEMGAFGAAAYDAWKKSQSDAWGALNVAQSEAIDKATKVITNANSSASELHNIINDRTASSEMKMAAALKLAKDGDFNDLDSINRARQVLQANQIKLKELNTEIDKNQAHIAYDFTSQEGKDKFKQRVDLGKIDTTKMHSDAYENQDIIQALEDYHGRDTTRVLETAFKRGKKYETSVSKGLIGARDVSVLNDDKFAKLHAKLTGDIAESFKKGLSIDHAALGNYLNNAKAADINKISRKNYDKVFINSTIGQASNTVASNITYAKLKAMHRQGDNPELVREIRQTILTNPTATSSAQGIRSDAELMSV